MFEEGYVIQRSIDSIVFDVIDTVDANITTFTDSELSSSIKYYYRVYGFCSEGVSEFSNCILAQPGIERPSDLSVEVISSSQINLSWNDNSANEDGFIIERSENEVDLTPIDTVSVGSESYNDTGLSSSTIYYYRIFAYNSEGVSDYSDIVSEKTQSDYSEIKDPLFNWNLESDNITLDEGTAQQDLTDIGNVTTGGTEPNPPGFGSVGGIFNGSSQYLSLSNDNYGDRALNGTDTDGTIYMAFKADAIQDMPYLWSKYEAVTGKRQLAIAYYSGAPRFLWGYNSGDAYTTVSFDQAFDPGTDLILALSLDCYKNTYDFVVKDLSTNTYYSLDETDIPLLGTYNTGTTDMTIGSRSDGSSTRSFDGTIYWVRIYDEIHPLDSIKYIMEHNVSSGIENRTALDNQLYSYPNPFSTETTISYNITKPSTISLKIYNISGQLIKTLVNRKMDIGSHSVQWDGCNENGFKLPQGTYCCRLTIDNTSIKSGKILIMR